MQYDLFHAYTVDAHTLFVLSNLRRCRCRSTDSELPMLSPSCSSCQARDRLSSRAVPRHCEGPRRRSFAARLVDAEAFCLEQGLSRYDARLVAWLVQNHLELSVTAQKQDISDPEVINAFARRVGDEPTRLSLCADQRRRARHESEIVEFVEGLAVPGIL